MAYVANYLAEGASAISYGTDTYPKALLALAEVWGRSESQCETLLNAKYGAANFATAAQALGDAGVVAARNQNGVNCWAFASDTVYPVQTATSAVNSNTAITTTVEAAPVINTTIDSTTQTVTAVPATKTITAGGVTQNLKMFAGSAIQAISGAGLGISLGKTIDSTLYNLAPDFWDSVGMSSLNPETWASITNGDDSFAAGLFNTVFGIDTDTGYGQMYLDENAAAYLAYWMAQQGMFVVPQTATATSDLTTKLVQPLKFVPANTKIVFQTSSFGDMEAWLCPVPMVIFPSSGNNRDGRSITFVGDTRTTISVGRKTWRTSWGEVEPSNYTYNNYLLSDSYTYDGKRVYSNTRIGQVSSYQGSLDDLTAFEVTSGSLSGLAIDGPSAWTVIYGNVSSSGGIEGIGTQPNATLPDTSTWTDPASTLTSLQSQYPDLWNDAFENSVVQPDGSVLTKVYIPVATPNVDGMQDTQPVSTEQTQQTPQVVPSPTPSVDNGNLLQTIIKYITQTKPEQQTQPDTETDTPTEPTYPDTGTGDTTPPIVPTGSASALWSVYHPTQAQVDQFGAWLWSDLGLDLDTLKKILNDPMNGIITLHKIFAPPVDSGSASIVVGRLDSGVASATVNQQYVTVDCGSVDLLEYFGNVFDYDPYTDVSLYLPFIGIVSLDTADVMRSTVHVTYGVDVYTGACLAQVEVSRDGCTVNMYQYAGLCSVEYPLTGAQHSGLISGLLGVGVGIATGNVPAVIGGAATAMKVSKSRANGFSGNAGAMGIKTPYLIISRPQTKVAQTFPGLQGYPTNYSTRLGDCSGQVVVRAVHVEGIPATEQELKQIENLLMSGVLV